MCLFNSYHNAPGKPGSELAPACARPCRGFPVQRSEQGLKMKTKLMAVMFVVSAAMAMGCGGVDALGEEPRSSTETTAAPPQHGVAGPEVNEVGAVQSAATSPQGWPSAPVVGNADFNTLSRGVAPGWSTWQCAWLDDIIAFGGLGETSSGAVLTSLPSCGIVSEPVSVATGYGAYRIRVRYLMANGGYTGNNVVSIYGEWLSNAGAMLAQDSGGSPNPPCTQNPCEQGALGTWSTGTINTYKPANATRFQLRLKHNLNYGGDLTVDSVKVDWLPPAFPSCFTDDSLLGHSQADVLACMGTPCTTSTSGTTTLLTYYFNNTCGTTNERPGFVKLVNGYVTEITFYTPPA